MVKSAALRQRALAVAVLGLVAVSFGVQAQSRADRDDFVTPVLDQKPAPTLSDRINYAVLNDGIHYDQFIVYYRQGDLRSSDQRALNSHLDAVANATGHQINHLRTISTGGQLIEVERGLAVKEMQGLMEALAADPAVEYVEPNAMQFPLLTPNDTSYSQQWHYSQANVSINAPAAWDVATGTGIRVAVLDTGITSHADLNGNVIAGYDFVSNATNARDGNGRDSNPADQGDWVATANECYSGSTASNSSWHGTHVAGTIAAVTNNASGVAGVAYNAKIIPVRVLAKCGGTLADIADAITWSSGGTVSGITNIAAKAHVINMSLGGGGTCGATYQNAINGAVSRGTAVIVAAGNSNTNASNATPANCSNVITIAATNRNGGRSYYSNYGAVVDFAAPGGDVTTGSTNGVLSTLNSGTTTPGTANYAWYQGTSMATPHAAGVAALVLSKCSKTPAELETLMKGAVNVFPATCSQCGTGIINARKAVDACGTIPPPGGFFENGTDFTINDNVTFDSPISVTGRTGNAPTNLQVAVTIYHTYRGDVQLDLVAPDGSLYRLKNTSSSDSADNVIATYTVNASSEVANGSWKLRVRDAYSGDTGRLDKWSLQF